MTDTCVPDSFRLTKATSSRLSIWPLTRSTSITSTATSFELDSLSPSSPPERVTSRSTSSTSRSEARFDLAVLTDEIVFSLCSLLRLTTDRCTDHGLSIDLVCLNKMPLHSVPLFSFLSPTPELGGEGRSRLDGSGKKSGEDYMARDPLYFDSATAEGGMEEMELFYSVAFWVYCSFWSKTNDKRDRPGEFLPRVKMSQVQNMGVLNHGQ